MTKEQLKEKLAYLINMYCIVDDFINTMYENHMDMTESLLYEKYSELFCNYARFVLNNNDEAYKVFEWYVYEYLTTIEEGKQPTKKDAKAFDKDGKPITYDLDSLTDELMELL